MNSYQRKIQPNRLKTDRIFKLFHFHSLYLLQIDIKNTRFLSTSLFDNNCWTSCTLLTCCLGLGCVWDRIRVKIFLFWGAEMMGHRYSMFSIKRTLLLNVLFEIFPNFSIKRTVRSLGNSGTNKRTVSIKRTVQNFCNRLF